MLSKTFTFTDEIGSEIFVYLWKPETEPKAVIQIAHGMVETAARYERLAHALTEKGYVVYANDHIGHGNTAKEVANVGRLPENGFDLMVLAMHKLTKIIKKDYSKLNIYLLGHSMGSFLTQRYIEIYGSELKGAILSGTVGKIPGIGLMKNFVGLYKKMFGADKRTKFLTKVEFGGNNKNFKPAKTPFDWISSDDAEVKKYINNPYCGNIATIGFYYELTKGLSIIHLETELQKIPKGLPIYIFSGALDPVSDNAKTVKWLINKYKSLGIKDVKYKIYPGGRHEMLNEVNRDEVTTDLINWLISH